MSLTQGLELPFGIQPVNPVPVDSYSGPYTGSPDTEVKAKEAANAAIPSAVRFKSMEVRLIIGGVARKYWYRDGITDTDLVEFKSSEVPDGYNFGEYAYWDGSQWAIASDPVKLGIDSGETSQSAGAVAIGNSAGKTSQGLNSVAIGKNAGKTSQGANSIAIGNLAGETSQDGYSIILNATGVALNSDGYSRTYIDPIRNIPSTGANTKALVYDTVTKEVSNIDLSGISETFASDITINLFDGKTFGKYLNGENVPSTGKTPEQVIKMAMIENPVANLSSSTTVEFNQTAISNVLSFDYTINSIIGGTISTASLDWRRGGVGSWTNLSTSTTTPDSYTHTLTDTAFNPSVFNYRYIVTDTKNETVTKTFDITPIVYVAPTIVLNVTGDSLTLPETNLKRERGNVATTLSGTITRNSPYVDLTSYVIQYQVNGAGAWTNIGSVTTISGGSHAFSGITHNDVALKTSNSISYRVKVTDTYQDHISSYTTSSTSVVNFLNIIFYGPVSAKPTTSSGVRALPSRIFTDTNNPFELNTGNVEKIFTVAMPATLSITQVLDLDALNANITSSYIVDTFNVDDAGSTATSYKVYTMTNSVKYESSHRHQVTRE